MNEELEAIAARLEESGDYRVIRRLRERDLFRADDGSQKRIGVILDVETTGLDPTRDEIIELAMLKFEYGPDGSVFRVLDQFSRVREPSIPIPIEITKLTGITPEMVAGKVIAREEAEHCQFGCGGDRPQCRVRSALRRARISSVQHKALGMFDEPGGLGARRF
jgi:hypothetical protein